MPARRNGSIRARHCAFRSEVRTMGVPVAPSAGCRSARPAECRADCDGRIATLRFSPPARSAAVRWLAMLLGVLCAASSGCIGYQFGPQAFFRPDIRTIHIPIVRNDTFRHDLGVRLTEALVREVQQRTPYIVTSDPNADSVLTCRFDSDTKRVLTETETDEVRALEAHVMVQASWISRRGEVLMENRLLPEGNLAIMFSQDSRIVPEAGQSIESELQEAIENLAERIVSQMEARWE